jgi:hypothetical protein
MFWKQATQSKYHSNQGLVGTKEANRGISNRDLIQGIGVMTGREKWEH